MESYYVATFHSVSQALRFEKLLQSENIGVRMIPVPRVISSSCGIAARFSPQEGKEVGLLISKGRAAVEEVYRFESKDRKMVAERLPPDSYGQL